MMALLFALDAIKECKFSKVRVHMDVVEVAISIKGSNDWSVRPFIGDILKCLRHFESFEMFFIPRELNMVVDYLTKGGQSGLNILWPDCD